VWSAVVFAWVVVRAAVGWSRLYLGYHWLTDVVAGRSVGVTVVALAEAVTLLTDLCVGKGRGLASCAVAVFHRLFCEPTLEA
jgi:undecaprenyl-diphosphatase